MFVPPLYVFAPFRLTLPLPSFVKLPAPLITPFKLLSWVELCKVASPAKLIRLLTVTPAAVVNAVPVANVAWPVPNELSLLIIAVPALMFVPPLYVFAPFKVRLPLPSLNNPPLPLTEPFKVTALTLVLRVFIVPLRTTLRFATISPVACNVPFSNVSTPASTAPKLASLPTVNVLFKTFVPPNWVLVPVKVKRPPSNTSCPVPPTD